MLDNDTSVPAANLIAIFLPLRRRSISLILVACFFGVVATFFGVIGIIIAWARLTVTPERPTSDALVISAVVMSLSLFFGLMASWLFMLGIRCGRMRMEASEQGLILTTSLYEWFLWNPWGIREVRLRWDEVKGLRLWPIRNRLAPGGVQLNYVVYTAKGTFVLSSVVWPRPDRMVAVIAERTGLHMARSVAELPQELASEAQPSRKEKIGVKLLRGLGWAAMVMGWLVLAAAFLTFVTGQEWKGSKGFPVIIAMLLIAGGHALRNFRLD